LHLRNIGRTQSFRSHSNAEILPPTEEFSVSRKNPQVSIGTALPVGFLSRLFTGAQLPWG
jgi:hypothetical protein